MTSAPRSQIAAREDRNYFPPMASHLDKVLAHAERQLASQGKTRPSQLLDLYKKFMKIEEHRLRLKHYAGGGGREIASRRVDLLDVVLSHLYREVCALSGDKKKQQPASLAVVAIGGYGRGELNPFSDGDVMFLHDGVRSAQALVG